MIRSLRKSGRQVGWFEAYALVFYVYLFAPLLVTAVLAFNDSPFPTLPWEGFTLEWFIGNSPERVGFFNDTILLDSIKISIEVAVYVSLLAVLFGTMTAFLFEREEFPFKNWLYFLMLTPLVIPGVILGISILSISIDLGLYLEERHGIDVEILRPGFWLVVAGQFSFITTLTTLIISARLRKFDVSLEEAAMNLGANRFRVIRFIILPYLRPALISAGVVGFLMSFENFNTTLFLIGSDPTLPVSLYLQVRDGSTPVINAASFMLMLGTALAALATLLLSRGGSGDSET